jgi:hypothetical protein
MTLVARRRAHFQVFCDDCLLAQVIQKEMFEFLREEAFALPL